MCVCVCVCVFVCVCKLFEILQEVFKDLKLQYFKFIVRGVFRYSEPDQTS